MFFFGGLEDIRFRFLLKDPDLAALSSRAKNNDDDHYTAINTRHCFWFAFPTNGRVIPFKLYLFLEAADAYFLR